MSIHYFLPLGVLGVGGEGSRGHRREAPGPHRDPTRSPTSPRTSACPLVLQHRFLFKGPGAQGKIPRAQQDKAPREPGHPEMTGWGCLSQAQVWLHPV